ncbi:hypothetical protein [Pseudomonas sp. XK-1]|uniref:hypothetical protein n=1 Tax=Pseudomonas sp. XK-1 TaxID=3136019 RepID=UPI00311A1524
MSIAAWIYNANVVIKNNNLQGAYSALKSNYENGKTSQSINSATLEKVKNHDNLVSFLESEFYNVNKLDDSIVIVDGDIDTITGDLFNLFEAIAPFVEPGSLLEIRDEEEQQLNLTFDGENVTYESDAF